jgi:DNA polymerase III epsilon subunit-like protein
MWRVLLDLLAAAKRPLVVVDFETAGLGGAPPVEFAVMIWAPWRTPEDDEETTHVRSLVPPGLTYACSQRLNPGQPIDPGAMAVHGITDADVAGCPLWSDLEVQAFFQGLAAGDAAEGEGPAIWLGHNLQNADLAWGRRWGYFPPTEVDAVDTLRMRYRLGREHPFPLAVDGPDCVDARVSDGPGHIPAIGWGLDAFAANLTGLHVGLVGQRPEASHGALADACATARVFARLIDLWSPVWPARVQGYAPELNLKALLAAWDEPEAGCVSWDGWLAWTPDKSGFVWRKGKFRGQPAHRDAFVLDLPRLPTGDDAKPYWCSQHTADILAGLRPVAVVR